MSVHFVHVHVQHTCTVTEKRLIAIPCVNNDNSNEMWTTQFNTVNDLIRYNTKCIGNRSVVAAQNKLGRDTGGIASWIQWSTKQQNSGISAVLPATVACSAADTLAALLPDFDKFRTDNLKSASNKNKCHVTIIHVHVHQRGSLCTLNQGGEVATTRCPRINEVTSSYELLAIPITSVSFP